MSTADKQIADILSKYGEPMAGNIWRVQGQAVIYHKALERIAAQANIAFDPPQVLRAERDEAVLLVTGRVSGSGTERSEWSIGEALVGVNYRVSGKQAAYVYAMAEKRAKDRVILKLIGLHGLLYSEEEADEFRAERPAPAEVLAAPTSAESVRAAEAPRSEPKPVAKVKSEPAKGVEDEIKRKIDGAKSINAVTDLMLQPETQEALNALPAAVRDGVRDHAKARLVALGWPSKKAA